MLKFSIFFLFWVRLYRLDRIKDREFKIMACKIVMFKGVWVYFLFIEYFYFLYFLF